MKKIFKRIFLVLTILLISSLTASFCYVYYAIKDLSEPEIKQVLSKKYSKIYDNSSRLIESLGEDKKQNITYNDLPKVLINALLSIEDNEFFYHNGINYKRIISSLVNNIFSSSTQGGSTITQQLVKNLLLSNEQSLKRKIQEAYLASILEQKMTKEEILEFYFNEIYFEGSIPGISYAAKRFFNKEVSLLNLVESATLVGLVKSPTLYSPFLHIDNCEKRKNTVLKSMLDNNYISIDEYNLAINKKVNEIIIEKGSTYQDKTYEYQAYLDVVYKEVENLTGLNPFTTPLQINTYLDTSLQSYLDQIQNGDIFLLDEYQQIGSTVINNSDASIIGIIGGKDYKGMRLFNNAYDLKRQPASTLKPIFVYALAVDKLNFHEYTLVEDKTYTYPNTNIEVHNADKSHLGYITLEEALGYSRNTSTLFTLEKLIAKIGLSSCVDYLKEINIMDEGEFTYPYAIGGMKYGISPTALAGAYAMLARGGNYLAPSTIKSIVSLDTGEVLYSRNNQGKQVISKESAYIISSTLSNIMDKNYYNISYAKPKNIKVYAKTGTNAYDKATINSLNYPSYADKDVWFAGYSKNYTIASWTGFEKTLKDKKTYFSKNDKRRYIVKDIFRETLSKLELDKQSIDQPSSITKVKIVKGLKQDYLPNDLIPNSKTCVASFKKGHEPIQVLPYPTFNKIDDINLILVDNKLIIDILSTLKDDELYSFIFGEKVYAIEYEDEDLLINFISKDNHFEIDFNNKNFTLRIYETFTNNLLLKGETYTYSSINMFTN